MSLLTHIKTVHARSFTLDENVEITSHPQFHEATEVQGWCFLEDDRLETQCGDKLEVLDDSLYCIFWASDLQSEYGNLQQALQLFFNHK